MSALKLKAGVVGLFLCLIQLAFAGNPTNSPSQLSGSEPSGLGVKGLFEILSYVGTVVTAVVAVIALKQLSLTQAQLNLAMQDLETRSMREAVSLAAQRCEDLANVKFPKITEVLQAFDKKGVVLEAWELNDKEFSSTSLKDSDGADRWLKEIQKNGLTHDVIILLNQLEGFAIYFANGAADEGVAFPVGGIPFCNYVGTFAPFIVACRNGAAAGVTSGKFPNTIKLFSIWTDRTRKEQIDAETEKMKAERATLRSDRVKPIGGK